MKKILPVFALAILSAPALALNSSGFRDAPVTRLNGEELKAFYAAVEKTLDDGADGATMEWKAPNSRFVSKVTPEKAFTDGKRQCRQATIESDANDLYQRGRYTFCKNAKGRWEFRIPAAKSKAK